MDILKRNLPFLFLILLTIAPFSVKNRQISADVVSHPDSGITFSSGDVLTQTWSPHTERISGISLPYSCDSDFSAALSLTVFPDSPYAGREPLATASSGTVSFRAGETGVLRFAFDTLSLTPGCRYLFRFTYQDPAPEGASVSLPSGSQYDGCAINGRSLSQALAMQVSVVKNSRIFWLYSILLPLFSFSLLLMLAFRRSFEEVAGLALSASVGLLYLAGLAEHLKGGIGLLYVLSLAALLASVYLFHKKQTDWRALLSPGCFVFIILVLVILVYNNHMYRAEWDEYSHWGLAVKDMFYYGSFAKHADSTVMIPWYPPFITLFQYFLEYQNGIFSESLLYVAFQIAILSFSITALWAVTWKRLKYLLPALAILLFIPVIFFPEIFNSIYVDPLLAVFMAYTLICYYTEPMTAFNFLRISGGLFALTLTKEMGAPIAGLLVVIFLLDTVYKQRKLITRSLLAPCALMLVVFVCFFSWRIYLAVPSPSPEVELEEAQADAESEEKTAPLSEPSGDGSSSASAKAAASGPVTAVPTTTANFTLPNMIDLLTGNAPAWRYQCIHTFIETVFSRQTYSLGVIGLSITDILFLLLLAALLLRRTVFFRQDQSLFSLCAFGTLCAVPYLGFLLLSYLFAFSTAEALMLHSYYRYAGSYLAGLVLAFAVYVFLGLLRQEDAQDSPGGQTTVWTICLSVTLLLCMVTPLEHFVTKNIHNADTADYLYGCDEAAETLRSFSDRTEKVYLVCNNNNGFSYFAFRNAISPLGTQEGSWDLYSSREQLRECHTAYPDVTYDRATILSPKDWAALLSSQYEYVFLLHPNELFAQMYGDLFEDPSSVQDGAFYKVIPSENGEVMLSYIGKIGIKRY